uniref:Importin subunit alpha n=1 Tax=Haptolina brevifila TaxID=156173 RepID=A0A7S2NH91_9EUKA|mmetsp:Transcript_78612/g.156265  ORF Transcript_78612/g.156265 Transcript_78612/m.156265 type:complete len:149 (+) Transcript_78612:181-627(+)
MSGSIPTLVHMVNVEEFDIKKEAAYALCNACIGGSIPTVSGLVSAGILPSLCSLLDLADTELILAVCAALAAALAAGEASAPGQPNPCVPLVDQAGGVEKVEELQHHPSPAVYERAVHLIDTYFSEPAADDPTLAPTTTSDGYVFGLR